MIRVKVHSYGEGREDSGPWARTETMPFTEFVERERQYARIEESNRQTLEMAERRGRG